jgi:transcription elongation factor Elf1
MQRKISMDKHFWCTLCGIKKYAEDLATGIKDGSGLCKDCDQQLERELGRGVREYVLTQKKRYT